MTRERARAERRDLDKERGEPVAGDAVASRGRSSASGAPLGDWSTRPRILVTNDDGIESRGLLALKQALDPIGDVTVVAPDTNQSAVGHQKTLMRPLRVRERTLRRRLDGLLGRRVAHRCRQPRVPGLLRARLRPRRLGHQLRREPGRRHHLLGDGVGGHGGRHQQLPGVRDLAGVLRAIPTSRSPARPRRSSRATSSSTASTRGELVTSTCRAVAVEDARASRSPGSGGGSTRTSSSAGRPARDPVLLDRRPAAVGHRRRGHRLPRGGQPADLGHAHPPRPDRPAACSASSRPGAGTAAGTSGAASRSSRSGSPRGADRAPLSAAAAIGDARQVASGSTTV